MNTDSCLVSRPLHPPNLACRRLQGRLVQDAAKQGVLYGLTF